MSSVSHVPPRLSTSVTRRGVLRGLRDVAMTLWMVVGGEEVVEVDVDVLELRMWRARDRPKPDEQPVISQTF